MTGIDSTILLGALLGGVAVALFAVALSGRQAAETSTGRRLSNYRTPNLRALELSRTGTERLVRPGLDSIGRAVGRRMPAGVADTLQTKIVRAGMQERWTVTRFLTVKTVVVAVFALLGIQYIASGSGLQIIAGVLLPVIAWRVPDILLTRRAQERQQAIELALPDALDQMTIAVEAGLGFEAAIQRVAKSDYGPLSTELSRVLQDIQLGLSRRKAFDSLLERTDSVDLRQFVATVRQAEESGISIAHVLRTQAELLRNRRRERAEEGARKLPVKMVFPLALCLLPALFIVMMGPAVLSIFETFNGS